MSFIRFPILHDVNKEQSCRGKDTCSACPLFLSKRCPGCLAVGGRDRCRMCDCETNCSSCGGFKVAVPAVCIKSPLHDLMLEKVETIRWDKIQKGHRLKLDNKAVLVMNGGKRPMFRPSIDSKRYDHIEAVGVSLWRVWSTRGWYSNDLKDYLGVPKRVKLIVTSFVFDDALERATNHEVMFDLRERQDVDAYMPLVYSSYEDDAVMNEWFQTRRTFAGMEEAGGDFVVGDMNLLSYQPELLKAVERVPQVIFYSGVSTAGAASQRKVLRQIAVRHKLLPRHVSFWFMGPSTPSLVAIIKRLCVGRECYFMTSAPWMASHKGHEFTKMGTMRKADEPQDELTVRAFENYSFLVKSA